MNISKKPTVVFHDKTHSYYSKLTGEKQKQIHVAIQEIDVEILNELVEGEQWEPSDNVLVEYDVNEKKVFLGLQDDWDNVFQVDWNVYTNTIFYTPL